MKYIFLFFLLLVCVGCANIQIKEIKIQNTPLSEVEQLFIANNIINTQINECRRNMMTTLYNDNIDCIKNYKYTVCYNNKRYNTEVEVYNYCLKKYKSQNLSDLIEQEV